MSKKKQPNKNLQKRIIRAIQQAIQAHRQGKLPVAEHLYRQVLDADPQNPHANHYLGLIAHQCGQHQAAITLIQKSIHHNPKEANAYNNLGNAFRGLGRFEEAQKSYQQAIKYKPHFPQAYNNLGNNFHDLGQYQQAIKCYQQALALLPSYAEAHDNLGNVFRAVGDQSNALIHYQKSIALQPNSHKSQSNLGVLLLELNSPDKAILHLQRAIEIQPQFYQAHFNLGNALRTCNKTQEAMESYQKALSIHPEFAEALSSLGDIFKERKDYDAALGAYRQALEYKPDLIEVYNNMGGVFHDNDRSEAASKCYQKALELQPDYLPVLNNYGNLLLDCNFFEEAISSYQKALKVNPNFAEAHNNLGKALSALRREKEAQLHFEQAINLRPDFAAAYNNLGNIYKDRGQFQQAAAHYRKAISINPQLTELFRHLTFIQSTHLEEEVQQIKNLWCEDLQETQKMHLAFALGKILDDRGENSEAFTFFMKANALKRQSFEYDSNRDRELFQKIKKIFQPALFKRYRNVARPDNKAIFILGMPRSGTSLVEQILSSHPRIFGAGELFYLNKFAGNLVYDEQNHSFPDYLNLIDEAGLRDIATAYLKSLEDHAPHADFITDKMPHNFIFIGLIQLLFPNARIIHCVRDPMAIGLSIFKHFFVSKHNYAYSLEEIGLHYRYYQDLMLYWKGLFGDKIYDIQYEKLIHNQEVESKKLISYLGLEWDSQCLSFYQTKRIVKTASATQVRKPIYQDAIQRWKKYEKELEPLRTILERGE